MQQSTISLILLIFATTVGSLRPRSKAFQRGLEERTILQNGQVRPTDYPDTGIDPSRYNFTSYAPNASEISYKGRWDSQHVSWWTAPGLKFGFTGSTVAITFGAATSPGVLIGYRCSGLDWTFTNISTGATHLLVSPGTAGSNESMPINPNTLEVRVTNWAYGIQIDAVHVAEGEKLVALVDEPRRIELIGDSLTSGMYTTYEGLSGIGYDIGAGLGDTEYSITACPGICLADVNCFGNPRGQVNQWFYTSDTGARAQELHGTSLEGQEPWDFAAHPAADLVIVNLGTNDVESNITESDFEASLIRLIQGVHGVWPNAQVMIVTLWLEFYQFGNSYLPFSYGYAAEIQAVADYFNSAAYLSAPIVYDGVSNSTRILNVTSQPFVKVFNTTGILQHNDIAPEHHPTDVGAIKIASHILQYIKLVYGWQLGANGPEIQHDTLYWNDQGGY